VCARQVIDNLFDALFCSSRPNGCAGASTQTFGHLNAKLNAFFRVALLQSLCIGVRDNELNAFKLFFDHVVDRVTTSTANTEYGDAGFQITLIGHRQIQSHKTVRLFVVPAFAGNYSAFSENIITRAFRNRHPQKRNSTQNVDQKTAKFAVFRQFWQIWGISDLCTQDAETRPRKTLLAEEETGHI
jgi:hypothetical protein